MWRRRKIHVSLSLQVPGVNPKRSFNRPAGAIATLVDTSCIIFLDEFATIQDDIITALNDAYGLNGRTYDESSFEFDILADHYFVVNPVTGQGISPKFDFSPSVGDFVVGTGSVSNPAPTGSQDINWLRLTNIEGSLSHEVYRVDTRGGQPPSSCDPYVDDELLVIYAAKYCKLGLMSSLNRFTDHDA